MGHFLSFQVGTFLAGSCPAGGWKRLLGAPGTVYTLSGTQYQDLLVFSCQREKQEGFQPEPRLLTAMGSKASGWLMAWCPDPGPDDTLVAPGPKSCFYEEYAQASVTFRDKPGFSQDGLRGMSPCCGSSGLPCRFHTRPCWCPNPSSFLPL